ncbi:hypothetical protein PR002_g15422 [Phytophthora rubi]|uniref:Fibronectin type-III domain-containing protein n=1 Tax=Phytophthora rubi TaxID=129364 RepID=A0A6A3KRM5_9STRA|nr:hypothetical protein PR002_g15422 [Phytophthora rubi]
MGKASRRKQLDEQRKQFFDIHGDGRSAEDRANARVMLDALQKKLEDDALREDGFYFVDGKYVDSRRPRLTSGMKTRGFEAHRSSITDVAIVRIATSPQSEKELMILFTFGLDCVSIWNLSNGELLSSLDVSSSHALFICGGAAQSKTSDLDIVVFAYATYSEPIVRCFDYQKNAITPAEPSATVFDMASNYCTGHQQAITSMAFSHAGELLATASWDSTCMIWRVSTDRQLVSFSPLKAGVKTNEGVRLTLLMILPVHEEGASCLAFTVDDQALVTCGECVIKVWDISAASTNNQEENKQTNVSSSLSDELHEWEQAIPFSFSIESSTNLFTFDESMTALVANHEWMNFSEDTEKLTLLAPSQSEDERNEAIDVQQCVHRIIDEIDPSEDEAQKLFTFLVNSRKDSEEVTKSENNSTSDVSALTPEEAARLRTQFRGMENFDFERLFTPALSLSLERNRGVDSIPAKTVTRMSSSPDANGRLIRSFSKITADGTFSSHSSTITDCAVAQELDLVVTVALDRSIRYWSLEQGVVLETVFDAHSASIVCCALTSPSTCDLSVYEMLLATGGSDNLVKVWRRNPPARAECVCSFSGHNDAVKSLAFDPSGVFLVSSSEDTTAIMWRVRPSSPDPPEKPTIVSVDRFSINVSWIEPLANGARILHYVVRTTQVSSFIGDGSDIVSIPDVEVPAKYLSRTIDKLQPGVKYTLQVAAVNQIGTSAFSAATEPVETLAFIPSRIDRPVQHENREATRITLSWTAPCPNGAAILSYTIQCRPENSVFVPVREVTLPVDEINVAVVEPPNLSSTGSTRRSSAAPRTLKTKDAAITAQVGDSKHRSKAVKTKSAANSSSSRTLAKVSSLKKTGALALPTRAVATLSYTVDELWAGEVYQFVVAASNRCGLGEFSRVSDYVKMDCMAPDQPEKPEIVSVDQRQIDVQWVKPRCNGSEVLQYTLRWCQQVEDSLIPKEQTIDLLTRSIAGTKYTLSSLEPGSPVQVWVSASNLVDNKLLTSLESLPSDAVATLCDVPGKPEAPDLVEPTAHTLLLTWTPPKRNGLPIDAYDVALYSEDTQFGVRVRQLSREFTLKPQDLLQLSSDARTVAFLLRHLRGDTFYSATVSACNSLGASGVSVACVPVQTRAPIVPDAIPEAPIVSDVTPTSVVVTWKLPSHDGGAALRGFHVEYSVRSNRSDGRFEVKMESGGDVTVSRGLELRATFLKPHRVYRFRVSPENRVGRASPSAWSEEFATPSLVEFTVTRYFAYRPPEEHAAARYIQRRYRAWKKAAVDEARFITALVEVLRHWHI